MQVFLDIVTNPVLLPAFISWFIACSLKMILDLIRNKRLDFRRFVGNGGMPSSHTAFVVALAVKVGMIGGFDSLLFAVAAGFAIVVMADAAGVRLAAGRQARILNEIVDIMHEEKRIIIPPKKLKELIGHTPMQVVCGGAIGIAVGILVRV
nr:divergent PAP2 family protein [bacterium]